MEKAIAFTTFVCGKCGVSAFVEHHTARDYDTGQRRPEGWDVHGDGAYCPVCQTAGDELIKGCPFCGGAAKKVRLGGCVVITCGNEDCMLEVRLTSPSEQLDRMIGVWNTRVMEKSE